MRNTTIDHGAVPRKSEKSAASSAHLISHTAPRSSRVLEMMDRAVARVLHVQPQQPVATTSRRPLETPLLLVGVRCTVRYIVLPVMLPLLGVATSATLGIATAAALGILLILDGIAIISIIVTLRRLWRHQHPRRWQYLPVALALTVLVVVFLLNDTRVLYA